MSENKHKICTEKTSCNSQPKPVEKFFSGEIYRQLDKNSQQKSLFGFEIKPAATLIRLTKGEKLYLLQRFIEGRTAFLIVPGDMSLDIFIHCMGDQVIGEVILNAQGNILLNNIKNPGANK